MKTVYMCFATDVIHEGHMNVVKKQKNTESRSRCIM